MNTYTHIGSTATPFPYDGKKILLKSDNDTEDIIKAIEMVHKKYAAHYIQEPDITCFWRGNAKDTANLLFDFLDYYIKYKVEPPSFQTVKTPGRLLRDKHGDCKHYATFTCGVADALRRKGYPISAKYRFVSDAPGMDVHHVFAVVTDAKGKEFWVDPVPNISGFNARPNFYNIKDYAMSNQIGSIYLLSGTDGNINGTDAIGNAFDRAFKKPEDIVNKLHQYGYTIPQFQGNKTLLVAHLNHILHCEQLPDNMTCRGVDCRVCAPKKQRNWERYRIGFLPGGHFESALYTNPSGFVKHSPPMVAGGMDDGSGDGSIGDINDGSGDGAIGISFKKNPLKQFQAAMKQVAHGMQVNAANLKHGMEVNAANAKEDLRKAGNVVLKVSLFAARKAFLSLVALNVRSLANTLDRIVKSGDRAELEKIWTRNLQGDWKTLMIAINNGSHRKRIGYCIGVLGVDDAAIASWVALAGAILAAIAPLLKKHGHDEQDRVQLNNLARNGAAATIANAYKAAVMIDAANDPTALAQETPQMRRLLAQEAAALTTFSTPDVRTGRMAIKPGITDLGEPQITVDDIDHPATRAASSGTNADGTPNVPSKGGGVLDDIERAIKDAWDNHRGLVLGTTGIAFVGYMASRPRRGKK